MEGLFGIIINIVNSFGGKSLSLLIGEIAFKESVFARFVRVVFGAFLLSLLFGLLSFIIVFALYPESSHLEIIPLQIFVFSFWFFIALELLRYLIGKLW